MTNVRFTDGVDFTFSSGLILKPGEWVVVVVANRAALETRYGIGSVIIAGTYTGSFRNGGEQVRLESADSSVIADFRYGDDAPWPGDADGGGYS